MNPFKFILAALRTAGVFGLYLDSGGGGSSAPASQTQISELPDWAKPTAQRLLGKAEALTEAGKYEPYKGERVAGFSPLQQQAFQGAAQMDAGPQAFGQQVGQYMSPYMQNVINREKMEAARVSQIQGAQQQARATQAGAFGGYREGIERAERERNLGMQMQDIQTRGLQSAYDRAADQFRSGITQNMAINQAQAQLGGVQQQRDQSILSQQYQDYLNQQRYPYQQLEFVSNILRGTPMGTVNTLYGGQPNLAGQIAGLGMGAYGLSKLFAAEGGMVNSYAEGGVTSEENVESILDGLSDIQLEQAKVLALNRGDRIRVAMIDAELAQRASLRSGLGGAFDSLPPESQESVFAAANGGMVAFADGGLGVGAEFGGEPVVSDVAAPSARSAAEVDRIVEAMRARGKTIGLSDVQDIMAGRGDYSSLLAPPVKQARAEAPAARADTPPAPTAKPPRAAGFSKQEAAAAVNTIVQGTGVQVPEDKTQEIANTLYSQMMERSKADRDSFRAELETAKGRAKEIEARGIGEALAKFGFGMAAAAAKPGRRQGLAGVVESAATASPILAESMAETQKLKAAAQDNYMKMRMENARYESAVEQGNMQLAATLANNISQRKIAQATLQQQIAQNDRTFALEKEKLGIMRSQADSPTAIQKIASDLMKEDPNLDRKSALQEASRIAGYSFRTEAGVGGKLAAELRKIDEEFSTLKFLDPNTKMAQNLAAQKQQRTAEAYRLYGAEQPGGVRSGAGQVYRFDAKGNPIQ